MNAKKRISSSEELGHFLNSLGFNSKPISNEMKESGVLQMLIRGCPVQYLDFYSTQKNGIQVFVLFYKMKFNIYFYDPYRFDVILWKKFPEDTPDNTIADAIKAVSSIEKLDEINSQHWEEENKRPDKIYFQETSDNDTSFVEVQLGWGDQWNRATFTHREYSQLLYKSLISALFPGDSNLFIYTNLKVNRQGMMRFKRYVDEKGWWLTFSSSDPNNEGKIQRYILGLILKGEELVNLLPLIPTSHSKNTRRKLIDRGTSYSDLQNWEIEGMGALTQSMQIFKLREIGRDYLAFSELVEDTYQHVQQFPGIISTSEIDELLEKYKKIYMSLLDNCELIFHQDFIWGHYRIHSIHVKLIEFKTLIKKVAKDANLELVDGNPKMRNLDRSSFSGSGL